MKLKINQSNKNNNHNDQPIALMLHDARMHERRMRAEVISNRMLNLATHIRTQNLSIEEALELIYQESEMYRHQAMEMH